MKDNFIRHVGHKIRLFRLEAGLSIEALAQKIGRTRKTVYNYETGATAVDTATLADIAQALGVSLFQLLDYEWRTLPAARLYPFGQFEAIDSLHMYHLQDGAVHPSLIRAVAQGAEAGVSAILYYKIAPDGPPDNCSCIYLGHAYSEYTTLSFVMRNHFNPAENILINLSIRNPGNPHTLGLISGLDVQTLEPVAFKVLVSTGPMPLPEARRQLEILPEEYRRLRATGVLRAEDG